MKDGFKELIEQYKTQYFLLSDANIMILRQWSAVLNSFYWVFNILAISGLSSFLSVLYPKKGRLTAELFAAFRGSTPESRGSISTGRETTPESQGAFPRVGNRRQRLREHFRRSGIDARSSGSISAGRESMPECRFSHCGTVIERCIKRWLPS